MILIKSLGVSMSVSPGQIVKNLIPSEPVTVNQIQDLGRMISLAYTGINSNISSNKVISRDEFEKLEVLTLTECVLR